MKIVRYGKKQRMVKSMAGFTCENWTLQDLSSALQDMHKDNKRILASRIRNNIFLVPSGYLTMDGKRSILHFSQTLL